METPTAKSQSSLKNPHSNQPSSKVRVVVRVRPFLPSEIESKDKNPIPCITVLDPDHHMGEEVTVHLKDQWTSRNECYKLDSFFGGEDHVDQIFRNEVSAVIPGIFHGLNGTIFAYGATGSGKTYTMQGTNDEPGLIPLAMSIILSLSWNTQYTVEISYFEIYLDRCYDLLEPKAKEVLLLDDKEGRLQLKGLSSVPLHSFDEFVEVFSSCIQRRKVAHTNLNDVSSRSHGVLSIVVTNGATKGKLNLIDLAGNEDNRRTCNEGIRLQESAKINQSLLALSNVIYALNNNEPRIPYRESKLTRILQDSLGGTSRTLMVACLSPASYPEAVHTVSLAARSRHVVNYVGSANKAETPKEKVDMEEKLRNWLESKGKAKSSQRMNGPFSPLSKNTPTSINHLKNSSSVSVKQPKHVDHFVSTNNGRELFDSAAQFSANMEMYPFLQIEKFSQQRHDEKEERRNDFKAWKPLVVTGPHFNKENQNSPTNIGGSPSINQKLQEVQNQHRKVLSPISSNITPVKQLSTDDRISLTFLDSKTPQTPYVITCDKELSAIAGTPLDKFNALGSNLKESLAQEYLTFLNVASKEELMQLKGIGRRRAEYILELREDSPNPLKSLSDLEKIGVSSRQVHDMFRRAASGIFS